MPLDLSSKRVMVTGGAGFLGRFVLEKLAERGCRDVMVPHAAEFDLTRSSHVIRALSAFEPDIVIHLAAVAGGSETSRDEPGRFLYENATAGIELIEQSRRFGVEKFVCIGTECGDPEETNEPYDIVNRAMLVQLQAYREQYGMNGIFLLPVNLYGPRDDFGPPSSRVIPSIIRACVEAKERGDSSVTLWGTGAMSRESLYVADAAEGIALATERYDEPDPVNLGTGAEIRIRDLAHKIAALTGFEGEIVWDGSQSDGQPRSALDTKRAEEGFGFRAVTSFDEGLARTVEWYHAEGRAESAPPPSAPYLPPVEEVRDGEQVVAIIVRGSFDSPGVTFFSESEFSQQLGFISRPAGDVIAPHVHNAVPREVVYTQETLFVREGRVRVDLYRDDRTALTTRVLTAGDAILLATGGHGFTMLDDTCMVEVKQGPYAGDGDKTRFEAAP